MITTMVQWLASEEEEEAGEAQEEETTLGRMIMGIQISSMTMTSKCSRGVTLVEMIDDKEWGTMVMNA